MNYEGKNLPMMGDLLLYKTKSSSWFLSKWIAKFSHTLGEDSHKGRYCHVSLVDVYDGNIIEMTWPRARRVALDLNELNKRYDMELWRVKCSGTKKLQAVDWARAHVGMLYDWTLLLFGWFDNKHKEVCSTFVHKAYLNAGFNLYPNAAKEKIVSPSELATSEFVERVW